MYLEQSAFSSSDNETMMKKGDIITKYVVYLCILTEMDEIAGWKRRN